MEVFKKILLIFSFVVATMSVAQANTTNGDEYWPFPLGSECPFAWNFVSSTDWEIMLNDELQNISFYISEESSGFMRIITVVYNDQWELIAYGNETYKEASFVLNLKLVDFRDDEEFTVKLRIYDNASKILPKKLRLIRPPIIETRMCRNMSDTSLAATVINSCGGKKCGSVDKHQILSRKKP